MRRTLSSSATFLLVTAFCQTAWGGPAIVEGQVRCARVCFLRDFRMTGEIVSGTVGTITTLIGQVHQSADQQHMQVGPSELDINSPGGSVYAAMSIGRLLRKERIMVTVAPNDVCASACVLILAGGVMRSFVGNIEGLRAPVGNIGIHRPYLEVPAQQVKVDDVKEQYGAMLQDIRAYFREMNVVEGLADAMLRIPPEEVHYLTDEEAKAYGLTNVDPVFQETLDLNEAQKLGLDRREYVRRKALADRSCPMPSRTADFNRWTACLQETLKTGRPPLQTTPDFSQYGTPAKPGQ